jgi:cytoskeleton protein RodZ
MEPQEESGLGNLLRTERENKGLSLERISEITRLRVHFLEALENEEWEKLPARVFVKGFIRSYAQTVGFDAEEAISLFDRTAPLKEIVPKPLIGSEKSKKKVKYIVPSIVGVIILAVILVLTWERYIPKNSIISQEKSEEEQEVSVPVQEDTKEPEVEENKSLPLEETGEGIEPEIMDEETMVEGGEKEVPPPSIEVEETESLDSDEPVTPDIKKYSLTGIISMRTYVRIYVDDNPPKEYIFQPGSRPQWTADKGFDVLVGNAAGIEFDFNGEIITDIGGFGKVKRLNFPKDFKSELYED